MPEGDWYCPLCVPIINAQYVEPLEISDSGSEARMEWDSSSESDSDVNEMKRRRYVQNQSRSKGPRVLISESESEIKAGWKSESDSDVDEMKRRRNIQNVCAIGEPRVLISESEEDSESSLDSSNEYLTTVKEDRGNSEGNDIEWITSQSTSIASPVKKASATLEQRYIGSGSSNSPLTPYTVQVENITDTDSIASGYCSTDVELNHNSSPSHVISPTKCNIRASKVVVPADSSTDKDSVQSFVGLLRNVSVPVSPHPANSHKPPRVTSGGVKINPVKSKYGNDKKKRDGPHKEQANSKTNETEVIGNSFSPLSIIGNSSTSTMSHSKKQQYSKHQNHTVGTVGFKAVGTTKSNFIPTNTRSQQFQLSSSINLPQSARTRPLQQPTTVNPSTARPLQQSARTRPLQRTTTARPLQHSSSASMNPKVQRKRKKHRRRRKKRRAKIVLGRKSQTFRQREHMPDGPYRPAVSVSLNERDAVFTRGKARTVASFTPQRRAIREAVRESYRHSNTGTGLEVARKIILAQHKPGFDQNIPFQGANYSYLSPRGIPFQASTSTPQSGYCTSNSEYSVSTHRLHADPRERPNYPQTPLSAYQSLVTNTEIEHRVASEISRRTVPTRKLFTVFHSSQEMSPSRDQQLTGNGGSSDGGLLDEICNNLDDLNNTKNVVKRDGSIVPISESNTLGCDAIYFTCTVGNMVMCYHFVFVFPISPGETHDEEPPLSQTFSSYISLLANYTGGSPSQPNPQGTNNSPQDPNKTVDRRPYPAGAEALSDSFTMDLDSGTVSDSTEPDLVIDTDSFGVENTEFCDRRSDSPSNHMTEISKQTSSVAIKDIRVNSNSRDSRLAERKATSISHMQLNPIVSLSKVIVKPDLKDSNHASCKKTDVILQWDPCCNGQPKPDLPVQCVTPSEEPSSSTDCLSMLVDITSLSTVERFMKTTLNDHYSKGHINRRQYKRILERAINKVKAGKSTTLERVKKLVSDFVDVYRLATS